MRGQVSERVLIFFKKACVTEVCASNLLADMYYKRISICLLFLNFWFMQDSSVVVKVVT